MLLPDTRGQERPRGLVVVYAESAARRQLSGRNAPQPGPSRPGNGVNRVHIGASSSDLPGQLAAQAYQDLVREDLGQLVADLTQLGPDPGGGNPIFDAGLVQAALQLVQLPLCPSDLHFQDRKSV